MLLSVDNTGLLGSSGYFADKLLLRLDSILLTKANIATYTAGQPHSLSLLLGEHHLALPAMVDNCLLKLKGANLYPRVCANPRADCQLSGDYLI